MNKITFIYPYYENPNMLKEQIKLWNSYDAEIKKNLKVIVIDDGSPRNPALKAVIPHPKLELSIYRIGVNIKWNQHGARNLGFHVCDDGLVLASDIDHTLPADSASKLFKAELDMKFHYTFRRVNHPNHDAYKAHCNSFVTTKKQFWKAGGYDEDYCGYYGGDGILLRALEEIAPRREFKDIFIVRWSREVLADASTNPEEFDRHGESKEGYRRISEAKRAMNNTKAINPLRFPWEKVL